MSRRSVAPPMRQHFPPKASTSSPTSAVYLLANARESAVANGRDPPSTVKKGVRLGCPCVRSDTGTPHARPSHVVRTASYAHRGSSPA
eukprot:4041266-Pleurochrysis_carterae.AAC.1